MDLETRPHRNSTGTSDLFFVCFASRASSSSMKISSKSILSPGRTDKFRDPSTAGPISLSSSLSRRLRSNGSMKGGQASPMFPTGTKKRGSGGFENPEPSSPKVTCIGQVRVKTKKKQQHGRKLRPARSLRRGGGGGGEVSFRRGVEQQQQGNDAVLSHSHSQECLRQRNHNNNSSNNQKWVHLPLTICEALRGFGAEFNCFLPCRFPSCASADEREREGEAATEGSRERGSSCGAALARWLVSLQEGEEGNKEREVELVVEEEEEEEEEEKEDGMEERSWRRRWRRGGIGELEFGDFEKGEILAEGGREGEGEEARSASVCVPPKNALLLMRCRSDPLRMSALANRLWESSVSKEEEEEDDDENGNGKEVEEEEEEVETDEERMKKDCEELEEREELNENQSVDGKWVSGQEIDVNTQISVEEACFLLMEEEGDEEGQTPERNLEIREIEDGNAEMEEEQEQAQERPSLQAEETMADGDLQLVDSEGGELMPKFKAEEANNNETDELSGESEHQEELPTEEIDPSSFVSVQSENLEEEGENRETKVEETAERASWPENQEIAIHYPGSGPEQELLKKSCSGGGGGLAESLLLQMRCEPKLSMEVSKETWVCSTDFIRRHRSVAPPPVVPIDGRDAPRKSSADSRPPPPHHLQPPRSSCSLPAPAARASVSMATMIGEKLVNAAAYEPFVLTRCKSEPMRSASKLALPPDACFWKSRKLGAAGVGF